MKRRTLLKSAVATSLAAIGLPAKSWAKSKDYPSHPIKISVGFAAGGQADIFARKYAEKLRRSLDAAVIIENKPGASASISNTYVARADPDGYTLSFCTSSLVLYYLFTGQTGYHPVTSFTPVAIVGETPMAIGVNSKIPAKTLPELIALIKANPGKYSCASTGSGGIAHYAFELFKLEGGGLDVVLVPYNGGAPAVLALMKGEVDIFVETLTSMLPHVESGNVRMMAYCGAKRSISAPDLPTVSELGFPGMEASTFNAILAPANTPKNVVDILSRATISIMSDPTFQADILSSMINPIAGSTPEAAREYIAGSLQRWAEVSKRANIKAQ